MIGWTALATLTACGGDHVVVTRDCPGDLEVATLAQLAAISDCRSIDHTLTIYQFEGSNVDALSHLESVGGLVVLDNRNLKSLAGLRNLQEIGGTTSATAQIASNPALSTLGLNSLKRVPEGMVIYDNVSLSSCAVQRVVGQLEAGTIFEGNNKGEPVEGCACELAPNVLASSLKSGATEVTGNLVVEDKPDGGLSHAGALTHISGCLVVRDVPSLTSLAALSSLQTVDQGLVLEGASGLHTLDGLGALALVGGTFKVDATTSLTSFAGVGPVETGRMYVHGNQALSSLDGLQGAAASWWLVEANPALETLNGLPPLRHDDTLQVLDNPTLTSFEGVTGATAREVLVKGNDALTTLAGMETLSGPVRVEANASLVSLEGLDRATPVTLVSNPALVDLSGLPPLSGYDALTVINSQITSLRGLAGDTKGDILLQSNPKLLTLDGAQGLTGVNTFTVERNRRLQRVQGLTGLTDVEELAFIQNESLIDLTGIGATHIGALTVYANPMLLSLDGLDGLVWLCGTRNDARVGSLDVQRNSRLTSIRLPSLTTLDSNLSVRSNWSLRTLDLPALASAGGIVVTDQPKLPRCEVEPLASAVADPSYVLIEGLDDAATCP